MIGLRNAPFLAALALCALPANAPAGEAPSTSAAAQRDAAERQLAEAQQQLDAAARRVAELSGQLGRRFNLQLNTNPGEGPPPRALLGVSIGSGAEKDGAHVMDVSPGGPAAEAGIRTGDVIVSVAGADLTKESNPGSALVQKTYELEPGLKVKVDVLRDGKKLSFDVMPRPAPQGMAMQRGGPPGAMNGGQQAMPGMQGGQMGGQMQQGRPGADMRRDGPMGGPQGGPQGGPNPGIVIERLQRGPGDRQEVLIERTVRPRDDSETRFGGVEFASLSERLGSYFGVKAGVLVVRAGVNSPLKLQDGDVILAIDGREATTAQQAGRILRSYQPGEKLTMRVQRERKAQNIEGTAPGGGRPN